MHREKAVRYFHGAEKYNCAQAVLKAFAEVFVVPEERIIEFARFGGGRAEGGLCGAWYGVKTLLADSPAASDLEQKFAASAGSLLCRDIRRSKTLSCAECVGLAAEILQEHLQGLPSSGDSHD